MKLCYCSRPVYIGSRCWRHYVKLIASKHGVARYRWWTEHFERIQSMLHGRYTIVKLGAEPAPVMEFLRLVWVNDPRPMWVAHKRSLVTKTWNPQNSKSLNTVLKIVATIERRARKDRNEANCRSQENQ